MYSTVVLWSMARRSLAGLAAAAVMVVRRPQVGPACARPHCTEHSVHTLHRPGTPGSPF